MGLLKEFRPALLFLGKFLVFYFLGNILYGFYVESHERTPDPVTRLVTSQSSALLNRTGYDTYYEDVPDAPKVALKSGERVVLNIFEGCNGLNVMIVFVAFVGAFGGPGKAILFFLPAGLLIIHVANLLRIHLLFHLADTGSRQFYYYHKYFFTASLYLIVFGLWAYWIYRFSEKRGKKVTA